MDTNIGQTISELQKELEKVRENLEISKIYVRKEQTNLETKLTEINEKIETIEVNNRKDSTHKLEQEIEKIQEALAILSTGIHGNNNDNDLEILLSESVWIPLIEQIKQLNMLLTDPQQSLYFPFNLLLKKTVNIEKYRTKEDNIIIEITYLDNKHDMAEIIPLTLCNTRNECFLYVPQGFGTTTKMFNNEHCKPIQLNTYFCSKSFSINCPTYSENCNPWEEGVPEYEPIQKNLSHVFWFPLNQERIQDTELKSYSNYLITFKENTNITIQGSEFDLQGTYMGTDIMYSLRISKDHAIVELWIKYWENFLMILGGLILVIVLVGVTIYVIKKKRIQKPNKQRKVRVNASRVYYRAPRADRVN